MNDVVVVFGDSQTQFGSKPGGFVNRLAAHYARIFDVLNRGYSGYTTDQARILAPRIFHQQEQPGRDSGASEPPSGKVRLVTVWFGSNDAAVEGHHQHVPLSRFRSNLEDVLKTIETRAPEAKVLLLTPATLILSKRPDDFRRPEVTRTYADTILDVVKERNSSSVKSVDLYAMFDDLAERVLGSMDPLLQQDGLHISDLGYELIFHKLVAVINATWPHLDTRNLQTTYPLWQDVLPPDKSASVPLEPRANLQSEETR